MALVKFNRTAKKATAIGSSKDADTLYFPTDEQSIYLGGKRVGGDRVSHAEEADHAKNADNATNAGHATNADNATNANHAKNADNATNATNASNATNAGTAGKVGNTLTLKLNSGSAKTFNGSANVTFDVTPSGIGAAPTSHTHTPSEVGAAPSNHNHDSVYSKLGHTHTPSEVGAAPSNHTHDIANITHAGDAAKMGVDTYISNAAASSSNLPTSNAVKDYIDRQIKNYTSAFRYAGTLRWSSNAWQVENIPADISETGSMDYGTFEGGGPDDTFLQTGFTFYVMSDGTFNGEQVEPGDMVTCVGLYDGEERWEPSYNIVNSNITVTESVDASETSTKVTTSGAVRKAINALDSKVTADTNYVLTEVTETDGKLTAKKQVAVDQTYSSSSSNPASGKAIAAALAAIGTTKSASSGYAITGITQENGVIKSITQAAFNNYTHPSHTATTGVPTANAAPGFGGTFQVNQISSDSQGHVTLNKAQTITIPATKASNSTDGLMSKELYIKLNDVYNALTWV